MNKTKLQELKKEFQNKMGISDEDITDEQMIRLNEELRNLPANEKTIFKVQEIVKSVTGIDSFYMHETLDNSDIDNAVDQLKDILDKDTDE